MSKRLNLPRLDHQSSTQITKGNKESQPCNLLTLMDYFYNLHLSRTKGAKNMDGHGPWPQTLLFKSMLFFQRLHGQYFFYEKQTVMTKNNPYCKHSLNIITLLFDVRLFDILTVPYIYENITFSHLAF